MPLWNPPFRYLEGPASRYLEGPASRYLEGPASRYPFPPLPMPGRRALLLAFGQVQLGITWSYWCCAAPLFAWAGEARGVPHVPEALKLPEAAAAKAGAQGTGEREEGAA